MPSTATRLVKQATKAVGVDDQLDAEALKAVKQFARQSDTNVALVADELWSRMAASDSLARFLVLQVCSELWPRSAAFRRALLPRLVPEFVQLVGGDLRNHPLPPPVSWATRLPGRALELVLSWHASHGKLDGYRAVALARRYLTAASAPAQTSAAAAASASAAPLLAEQREQRWREKYRELQDAAASRMAEIRRGSETMAACLRILAPSLDEGGADEAEADELFAAALRVRSSGSSGNRAWRGGGRTAAAAAGAAVEEDPSHGKQQTVEEEEEEEDGEEGEEGAEGEEGEEDEDDEDGGGAELPPLDSGGLSMEINLGAPEQRPEDHVPLLEALRDAHAEARNAFEPRLREWTLTLSRVTLPAAERAAHTALLQRVTAARRRLRELMARADPLLANTTRQAAAVAADGENSMGTSGGASGGASGSGAADGDDSDEFEDVTSLKPGYEAAWVDPDAGWEKPPPEAMRLASPPTLAAVGPIDTTRPNAATVAIRDAAAAMVVEHATGEPLDAEDAATASRVCGAERADGSLCTRRIAMTPAGRCPFHGVWVARTAAGRPVAPSEGSVWAKVLEWAREAGPAHETASGGTAVAGAAEDEHAGAWHGARSARPTAEGEEGEDSRLGKRPRIAAEASCQAVASSAASSAAASPSLSSAAATTTATAATASAEPTSRRKSKPEPTARERLAAKLAASARATANASSAHAVHRTEMLHRGRFQGW